MQNRKIIQQYLDNLLQTAAIRDYCPNGLQVEGKENIQRVITGVTASHALIQAAIAKKADAICVHHGYFWKDEAPSIIGMKYQRIKLLIDHQINLFTYHLPLDVHPEFGNNVQLAKRLDFQIDNAVTVDGIDNLLWFGTLKKPLSLSEVSLQVDQALNRKPCVISGGDHAIQRVAWCTGGAQRYLTHAALAEVDLYLSGEISEYTVHEARELGIHYISAGHHATERYGIQAIGEHLAATFQLDHEFIDIDNPV